MRLAFLLILLCLTAAPARAAAVLRVPGEALVVVAQDALAEAARRDGVVVEIEPARRPRELLIDGVIEYVLVPNVPREWLRARVGVPVQVRGDGRARSSALVWFVLRAPATAPVYSQAYPRGTAFAEV